MTDPGHGNNGVGNGIDPQPPGNPPINDGPGTAPGSPGNQGGAHKTGTTAGTTTAVETTGSAMAPIHNLRAILRSTTAPIPTRVPRGIA